MSAAVRFQERINASVKRAAIVLRVPPPSYFSHSFSSFFFSHFLIRLKIVCLSLFPPGDPWKVGPDPGEHCRRRRRTGSGLCFHKLTVTKCSSGELGCTVFRWIIVNGGERVWRRGKVDVDMYCCYYYYYIIILCAYRGHSLPREAPLSGELLYRTRRALLCTGRRRRRRVARHLREFSEKEK